jgi:P-type Cu2+ transporter
MFRDEFWLTLALTIPVVILSPDIEEWFGYSLPTFPGEQYAAAILGTIIFFYGGLVFFRGAQSELADRKPGMKMVQNLVWATGYNLVAIPIAMGVPVPGGSTCRCRLSR